MHFPAAKDIPKPVPEWKKIKYFTRLLLASRDGKNLVDEVDGSGIESDAWPGSDNIVISNNEIFTNGDSTAEAGNHGGGINIYIETENLAKETMHADRTVF